jgi:hypothetical protein
MHPKNYLTKGFVLWLSDYRTAAGRRFIKRKHSRLVRRDGKRQTALAETDA